MDRVSRTIQVMRNAAAATKSDHIFGTLIIITGKGLHSSGGRARIKPAVENWLSECDYTYESMDGKVTTKVPLRKDALPSVR